MDLKLLRAFVAVSEELHFGRAAERLRIAQPALSQRVQRLEAELGVRLLERDRHSVAVTAAGEVLQREARSVLAQWEFARERVEQAKAGGLGLLRLGFKPGPCGAIVARALALAPPDERARLRWVEDNRSDTLRRLSDGEFDAVLIPETNPPHPKGIAFVEIARHSMIIALGRSHPLAKHRSLPLSALAPCSFAMYSTRAAPGYRRWIQQLCRGAGFSPRIGSEVDTANELGIALASGAFVALVTEPYRCSLPTPVRFLELTEPNEEIAVRLWWRGKRMPTAFNGLVDLLKRASVQPAMPSPARLSPKAR